MIGLTYSVTNYNDFYKTGDKGIFEKVIDDLILDKYSDDDDLKKFIKNLPDENKRMSTLSLMSDDNVLWSKIYGIHSGTDTKYNKIKKIIVLLRDYVKIADVERKSHGEILTPFEELAKPMVNLMNKYDEEFWKDSTNKVLDSSAGYGTFLILCLYKFMEGLVEFEPDEDKRLKHIIENQLYYGELQAKSVFSWLVAIDPNDEYDTNIYWGSYLDDGFDYHMNNVWNVEKFDLIIQNPPYQMQKDGFKKTQPLWHLFVQKSLILLKEDKYMIMVHPGGWRNVDGVFKETQNLLKSKKIFYLKLHSFRQGQEMFDAAINFDYYILKNTNNDILTDIETVKGDIEKIDISKVEFISDENIYEIQNLVAKEGDEKVCVLHSYSSYECRKEFLQKNEDEQHIHKCVYTVKSPDKGNIPTFYYSSRNDRGHFGIPKVIWANGATGVFIDYNGEFGLTPFAQAIIDDVENFENIKTALQSEKFIREIMGFKHSLGDKYNRKIISQFRKDFWKEFI
jgi:hypothetical protein